MTDRNQFAGRLSALWAAANNPTLKAVAARAKERSSEGPSYQRISDWRRGARVPEKFESLEPVLWVLISAARAKSIQPSEHGLYDMAVWREWWAEAQTGSRQGPDASKTAPIACPYLGLASYTITDRDRFFGRERSIDEAVSTLQGATTPGLFVLYAASGTGKSSLLHAGIAGRAATHGLTWGSTEPWSIETVDPGPDPFGALTRIFPGIREAESSDDYRELLDDYFADSETDALLLIVDQFEQVLTAGANDATRDEFIDRLDRLSRVVSSKSTIRVVIGVRADFVPECLQHAPLADALQHRQIVLAPMSSEELAEAIKLPAAAANADLEPGLSERIISDLDATRVGHNQSVLPLMSHVLESMWLHRDPAGNLTLRAYEAAGGIEGSVNRAAENAWKVLDDDDRAVAPALLLRLVQIGDGARDTRRAVPRAELLRVGGADARNGRVIDALTSARLLTVDDDGLVAFAHEVVIDSWNRLHNMISANRASNMLRQTFERDAAEWDRRGRQSADLWAGDRLHDVIAQLDDHPLTTMAYSFRWDAIRQQERRKLQKRGAVSAIAAFIAVLMVVSVFAFRASARSEVLASSAQFREVLSTADRLQQSNPSLSAQLVLAARDMQPAETATASRVLATQDAPMATPATGHENAIYTASYRPDGKVLATASGDHTTRLWDVSNPQAPTPIGSPLEGHTSFVTSAAWSPDGAMLATASGDGTVRLWDVRDPQAPTPIGSPLQSAGGTVYVVSFSPDGRTLAAPNDDGTTGLWDISKPEAAFLLTPPLAGPAGPVRTSAFSPDGKLLAVGSDDKTVWLWNVSDPSNPVIATAPLTGFARAAHSVAFSPNGQLLAAGSDDRTARVWNIGDPAQPTLEGPPLTGHTGALWSIAFGPDSQTLATASWDGTARLWNLRDPSRPRSLGQPLAGSNGGMITVAFAPDGATMATGSQDGVLRMWNRPTSVIDAHTDRVMTPRFSSDGSHMATGSVDGTLQVWDTSDPDRPIARGRVVVPNGQIDNLQMSPDGRTVLTTGGNDRAVRLWDASDSDTIRPLGRLELETRYAYLMSITPDGRTLVTGSSDNSLQFWDISDISAPSPLGQPVPVPGDLLTNAAFSPDGRTLAIAASGTNDITLLDSSDPSRPKMLQPLTGHTKQAESVVFSPDGKTLASAGDDQTIRFWDVAKPSEAQGIGEPLIGQSSTIRSVAFATDGRTLASGSDEGTVQLWDTTNIAAPIKLGGSIASIGATRWYIAFSPTSNHLAAGGEGGAVRLWNLTQRAAETRVCENTNNVLTDATWDQLFPELPYRTTC